MGGSAVACEPWPRFHEPTRRLHAQRFSRPLKNAGSGACSSQIWNARQSLAMMWQLSAAFADDWVIVDADGRVIDRSRCLNVIVSGALSHESMESTDVEFRLHGDSAVATSRRVWAPPKNEPHPRLHTPPAAIGGSELRLSARARVIERPGDPYLPTPASLLLGAGRVASQAACSVAATVHTPDLFDGRTFATMDEGRSVPGG